MFRKLTLIIIIHISITKTASYTISNEVVHNGTVKGEATSNSLALYNLPSRTQCGNLCSRQACAGYSLIEGDNDVTCALTADRTLLPVDDWETFVVVKETYSDFSDLVSPCELFFPV